MPARRMEQLSLDLDPQAEWVRVEYVSDKIDRRTGIPFQWHNFMDGRVAVAHVELVNAGLMVGPWGLPWGPVKARIAE